MRSNCIRFVCSLSTIMLFCADIPAQEAFEADSVILITSLETENELFTLGGALYNGEAFFLGTEDGLPVVMRSYVDGKQEGIWRTWHSNGRLYKEGELKHGTEHGRYLEYYETGILCYEYFYALGQKTGLWRSWYANGDIYTERNFKEGKLDGRLAHYSEDGAVLLTEEYRNGYLVSSSRERE